MDERGDDAGEGDGFCDQQDEIHEVALRAVGPAEVGGERREQRKDEKDESEGLSCGGTGGKGIGDKAHDE